MRWSQNKIFHFHRVFKVDDNPLWMVNVVCGWGSSILGGEFSLRGVVPSWEKAGVPRKGWSLPKKGSGHPQMAFTNFKNLCEKDKSYFDSTSLFVKYLGLKMI